MPCCGAGLYQQLGICQADWRACKHACQLQWTSCNGRWIGVHACVHVRCMPVYVLQRQVDRLVVCDCMRTAKAFSGQDILDCMVGGSCDLVSMLIAWRTEIADDTLRRRRNMSCRSVIDV